MITDLPLPPLVVIVRTVEELKIEHPADKIVEVANKVLDRYDAGDKTPSYDDVTFDAAAKRNRCQQNVRQLLEAASVFGNGRKWTEASCCAGYTRHRMHLAAKQGKYIEITDIQLVKKGDIVYLGGGDICSDCGHQFGHVMVCTGRAKDGTLLMWQNTTLGDRKLCEIPIIQNQSDRFVAAYRFFPKAKKVKKEVIFKTHNVLTIQKSLIFPEQGKFIIDNNIHLNNPLVFGGINGVQKLYFPQTKFDQRHL